MSETSVNVTEQNWAAEVEAAPVPVLVDFWAPWCQPCLMLAPTLDRLALEFEGRVRVVKANVEASPELANRFHIVGIPALLMFKDGKVVDALRGLQPEATLREFLNAHAGEAVLA